MPIVGTLRPRVQAAGAPGGRDRRSDDGLRIEAHPTSGGVQNEVMTRNERDDVEPLDTLTEPYGKAAYPGRGQAGDEVADALTAELEEEFASDDPASKFAPHREGFREGIVGRLVDDDALDSDHDDVTAHDSGEDDDLSAEEAALHYVDPEDDPIPE